MARQLDVSVLVRLVDRLSGPLRNIMGRFEMFIRLGQRFAQVGATMWRVTARLAAVTAVAAGAFGAMAGGALMRLGRAAIDTGRLFEGFQTQLETSFDGSAQKAKEALAWVMKFARETPYDVDKVTEAFVMLRNYGLDPTNGLLKRVGNMAAAMDKPLTQAVEAVADAVTFEFERLKQFGITVEQKGSRVLLNYKKNGKDITLTAKKTASGVMAALEKIMDARFSGAMDRMFKTLDGILSNIRGVRDEFAKKIADAGIFAWVKQQGEDLYNFLTRLEGNGTLDRWAAGLSNAMVKAGEGIKGALLQVDWEKVVKGVEDVIAALGDLAKMLVKADWSWIAPTIRGIGESLRWMEQHGGGAKNILLGIGAALVSPMVVAAAFALARALGLVGRAAMFATRALMFVPAVRLGLLLAGAALVIVRAWTGVKRVVIGVAQWLSGVLSGDFARAADGLRMAWSGLGTIAAEAWGAVKAVVRDTLQWIDDQLGTRLADRVRQSWGAVAQVAQETFGGLGRYIERSWEGVTRGLDQLTAKLTSWAETGLAAASAAIGAAFERLGEMITAPIRKAKAAWDSLMGLFGRTPAAPAAPGAPTTPSPAPTPGKQSFAPIGGSRGFAAMAPRPRDAEVSGQIVVRAAPGTTVERVSANNPRVKLVPDHGPVTARA